MASRVFWAISCDGVNGCCCQCRYLTRMGLDQWCSDLQKTIDSANPDAACRMPLRDETKGAIIGIEVLYE